MITHVRSSILYEILLLMTQAVSKGSNETALLYIIARALLLPS